MVRTTRSVLGVFLVSVLMTACLGGFRVPLLPRVNINVNRDETDPQWQRTLRTADGTPVSAATYRAGQPLTAYWAAPSPRADDAIAWAGVETQCASSAHLTTWGIVPAKDRSAAAELWRVTSQQSAGGSTLRPIDLGSLLAEIPVSLDEEVRWLAYVGDGAEGSLVLSFGPTDATTAAEIRPCPIRWVAVPLRSYIAAVRNASASTLPATPVAKDSFRRGATTPRPTDPTGIERSLGLIGVAEYDLQQLHQTALSLEFGGVLPNGITDAQMKWLRQERLQRLEGNEGGIRTLCMLGQGRGLFNPPLTLWSGDTTIPTRLREECRQL